MVSLGGSEKDLEHSDVLPDWSTGDKAYIGRGGGDMFPPVSPCPSPLSLPLSLSLFRERAGVGIGEGMGRSIIMFKFN